MLPSYSAQSSTDGVPLLVHRFLERATDLWWEDGAAPPDLLRTYSVREQANNERQLQHFVDASLDLLQHLPRTEAERRAAQERLTSQLGQVVQSVFGAGSLEALPADRFAQAVHAFVQQARHFDPALSLEDVFQAGRNAWTMNGLQWLLGLPVEVTPSVLAYSLLYPYTDNYLDDPDLPREAKVAFNERFRQRLAGEAVPPANEREQPIFGLVGMIEGQYDRAGYSDVYESLLAIHHGQSRSLRLLNRNASPYELDILGINLEKGGTSVLADGYLVAGFLTPVQAQFAFDYGAFVQLVDDLEDVQEDLRAGRLSIYSLAARRWPLDALASRTFRFGARVLAGLDSLEPPVPAVVKDLIRTGANLLIIDTINQASHLYTKNYVRELETHSPFHFSFLNRQRQRLARRRAAFLPLLEVEIASARES